MNDKINTLKKLADIDAKNLAKLHEKRTDFYAKIRVINAQISALQLRYDRKQAEIESLEANSTPQ